MHCGLKFCKKHSSSQGCSHASCAPLLWLGLYTNTTRADNHRMPHTQRPHACTTTSTLQGAGLLQHLTELLQSVIQQLVQDHIKHSSPESFLCQPQVIHIKSILRFHIRFLLTSWHPRYVRAAWKIKVTYCCMEFAGCTAYQKEPVMLTSQTKVEPKLPICVLLVSFLESRRKKCSYYAFESSHTVINEGIKHQDIALHIQILVLCHCK